MILSKLTKIKYRCLAILSLMIIGFFYIDSSPDAKPMGMHKRDPKKEKFSFLKYLISLPRS
jgi:hypothetical protein